MRDSEVSFWRFIGSLTGFFLLYDNWNGGPLHVSLILHEVGHWIFATLFTLRFAEIKFYFHDGSGVCSYGPTFIPLAWIIAVMGVGFQNIVGALLWRYIPPRGIGQFFKRIGVFIYLGGFLDISIAEPSYTMMLYGDFGRQTVPKLLLLGWLNYFLVKRVIMGKKKEGKRTFLAKLGEEFMVQAGYRK